MALHCPAAEAPRDVVRELEPRFKAFGEAVRLIPADPPSNERAQVLASYAETLFDAGRSEEARVAGEGALATARRLGAERELGRALMVAGLTQAARGTFNAGIAFLQAACRVAGGVAP